MSIANLKKMKKELLIIRKENSKYKFIVKALDGLFLIDLSKIGEGRIVPIDETPEGMNIEVIGAKIDDIVICGGVGCKPVLIVNDIPKGSVNTNIHTINIVPASKHFKAIEKED